MAQQNSYKIYPYSIKKLIKILSEKSDASVEAVKKKLHSVYFKNYFKDLKAQTILVENDYVDHDFLEDFTGYYVKCFKRYKRKCVRLHFFNIEITKSKFETFLNNPKKNLNDKILSKSYIGFIVVKPLPKTIIGRTCLKTYSPNRGRRHYPIFHDYPVNLFGIPLCVRSIAYQEQDNVVAACATSALWSVFHGTGKTFQHPILSPVEITRTACDSLPLETRFLPNDGLTITQMAHAIRSVNLEPFLIKANDEEILKSTLYAYLKGGVPLLMGILLVDTSDVVGNNRFRGMGNHAVAITGYSTGEKNATPQKETGFLTTASRIDKIYAHDDQVGPFSRMVLNKGEISYLLNDGHKDNSKNSMHTSWIGKDGKIGSVCAISDILLVPLYNKIRIPFGVIYDCLMSFDAFIEEARTSIFPWLKKRIVWDIYLETCNNTKSDILFSEKIKYKKGVKMEVLLKELPRFLWRATARSDNKILIDFLFDATDIEQGAFLTHVIKHDELFFEILKGFSTYISRKSKGSPLWKIFEWFNCEKSDGCGCI